MKKLIIIYFIFSFVSLFSQDKVVVLPFINSDGKLEKQNICYELQDSLYKSLELLENKNFELIPIIDVETALADLNIDPSNPQYKSDMWKACKILNANKVITGNFNFEAGKFLVNAYIYDVRMKMPNPKYQAKDIFKTNEAYMSSIPEILDALKPALVK